METDLEYQDLLYFGYDYGENAGQATKDEEDFINQIKEKFPNVKFTDAYDSIKGCRQEVYLNKENNDNYYSWVIGKGWIDQSFTMQLMIMSGEPEHKEKIKKYFTLAKQQYPEAFKPEALLK